jgi:hypothetical protein
LSSQEEERVFKRFKDEVGDRQRSYPPDDERLDRAGRLAGLEQAGYEKEQVYVEGVDVGLGGRGVLGPVQVVSDNNQENGQGLDVVDPANAFYSYLSDEKFPVNRSR